MLLTGCATYRDALGELSAFSPLAELPQVRYAPGAEHYARRVAALLPRTIGRVEGSHYRPFRTPPVVYVCDSDACFHRFVAARLNFTAAVVYDNRLVLAPRLFEREPQRLEPILTHELSHLHIGQQRGHYSMAIPVWFHEGLASLVAAGGGADLTTDRAVFDAARRGRHFLPDEQHLPWMRRTAAAWDLSIHVFYRQAYVFLRELRARDPAAFRSLLLALQDGEDFDAAFAQSFHANPARAAAAYFAAPPCVAMEGAAAACDDPQAERLVTNSD